jgi:hypothetical protein
MTALADLLSPADRDRLVARLAELRELAALMRERGHLPQVPEPPPLHRMPSRFGTTDITDTGRTTTS